MTFLREIQLLLERTYAPVPLNLELCVIGPQRCAALTQLAGESAKGLAPAGRTFLRRQGDSLHLAIFYAAPVIAELEANDPRTAINERNINALITFVEEIAHAVQAALLFLDGQRTIETEAFARNLETQARVDTYLVLSKLAQIGCGERIPRRVGVWLRRQVFDRGWRRFGNARLRARYRSAEICARGFLRRLRHVPLARRTDLLREFRAMTWEAKLAYALP